LRLNNSTIRFDKPIPARSAAQAWIVANHSILALFISLTEQAMRATSSMHCSIRLMQQGESHRPQWHKAHIKLQNEVLICIAQQVSATMPQASDGMKRLSSLLLSPK